MKPSLLFCVFNISYLVLLSQGTLISQDNDVFSSLNTAMHVVERNRDVHLESVRREAKMSGDVCTQMRIAQDLGCACYLENVLPSWDDPDFRILCQTISGSVPEDLDILCTRFTTNGNIEVGRVLAELERLQDECSIKAVFEDENDETVNTLEREDLSDEELFDLLGIERVYSEQGELVLSEESERLFGFIIKLGKKIVKGVKDVLHNPIEAIVKGAKDIIKNGVVGKTIKSVIQKAREIIHDPVNALFEFTKGQLPFPTFLKDPVADVIDFVVGNAICVVKDVVTAAFVAGPARADVRVPLKKLPSKDWTAASTWGSSSLEVNKAGRIMTAKKEL